VDRLCGRRLLQHCGWLIRELLGQNRHAEDQQGRHRHEDNQGELGS